jgi:hypothetical protein
MHKLTSAPTYDTSPLLSSKRDFKSLTAVELAAKFLTTVGLAASGHVQEERVLNLLVLQGWQTVKERQVGQH